MADTVALQAPQFLITDYNTLVDDMLSWLTYVSEGRLEDSNSIGVVNYLFQAQAWAFRELELYLEELPNVYLYTFLSSVMGIERRLGTKAQALVEFTLKQTQSISVIIPANFIVAAGELQYFTVEELLIPAGALSGQVVVEAENPGSQYNLGEFLITDYFQPISGLEAAQNTEPALGGTDEETEADTLIRAGREIRRRDTIQSVDDLEDYAKELIGPGSGAKAVEWYTRYGTNRPGETELYCVAANGVPLNNAQRISLQSSLSSRVSFGLFITVKPMLTKPLDLELIVTILDEADPEVVAEDIYNTLFAFLNSSIELEDNILYIEDIRSTLRFVDSITRVNSVHVDDELKDVLLPNNFTIPVLKSLRIDISDNVGDYFGPYLYDSQYEGE